MTKSFWTHAAAYVLGILTGLMIHAKACPPKPIPGVRSETVIEESKETKKSDDGKKVLETTVEKKTVETAPTDEKVPQS